MENIIPIKKEHYNCFDCVIASLAQAWNFEFRLMYANHWGFKYKPYNEMEDLSFGARLKPGWNGVPKTLLKKNHGLYLKWHKMNCCEDTLNLLSKELSENRPVAIYIDAFFCPWNLAYGKYHIDHVCLVINIDEQKKILKCIDPFSSDKIEYLYLDSHVKYIDKCCTILLKNNTKALIDWKMVFLKSISRQFSMNNNIGSFKMMHKFAEDLSKYLNIEKELSGCEDIFAAPIIIRLKQIQASRQNFADLIGYISEVNHITQLEVFRNRFLKLSDEWTTVRNLLVRAFMVPNSKNTILKISDKVIDISIDEEKLAIDLSNVINN